MNNFMTLMNAHKSVFDQSILSLKTKATLCLRISVFGVLVLSVINISSGLAAVQEKPVNKAAAGVEVEIASVRVDSSKGAEEKSKGAEPIRDSSISLVPILDVDPELQKQLDRQFRAIQTLLESENAFSEILGENYFAYGKQLVQLARVDEAEEAFINALHIAKVNNGVESNEQRPMLRELFEISYAQRKLKETDAIAKRIVFLGNKGADNNDPYVFNIMMRLGHLHMKMYLEDPVNSSAGLDLINRAMTYFNYVNKRYGDQPISDVLMPYGEMALLWYLKYEIKSQTRNSAFLEARSFTRNDIEKNFGPASPPVACDKGLKYLKQYYTKAREEDDIENAVRALLNIGDLNLLCRKQREARQSYANAWALAESLPVEHALVRSFDDAVKLPNFKYALIDSSKHLNKEFDEIPLWLTIDSSGRVKRVEHKLDRKQYGSNLGRAIRIVKKYKFRPILENGKPLKISTIQYRVKLPVIKEKKRKKTDNVALIK